MESSMKFLNKLKLSYCVILLYHPWAYIQRNNVSAYWRYLHTHVYSGTIHNSQVMESGEVPLTN
jgi:hypothetical protein